MFSNYSYSQPRRAPLPWLLAIAFVSLCVVVPLRAQCSFNSGSTGADGVFNPVTSQTVTLPASGVFNFTTVNIPRGVTIKFTRNATNTPVTMLASGNINIAGIIDVSGAPGTTSSFGAAATSGVGLGGPGGFDGGRGGFSFAPFFFGTPGDGPGGGGGGNGGFSSLGSGGGGGFASAGGDVGSSRGGYAYGARTLVPLIGGSGGGGHGTTSGVNGFGGGGGGGAILLASSGTILFGDVQGGGSILANGGTGGSLIGNLPHAGGGAGGAIRLVANTISGKITLQVQGANGVGANNGGGHGYLRVEACDYNGFQPTASPVTTATNEPIISLAQPSSVIYPNAPTLRIVSVAGLAAPVTPTGSFHGTPDIIIPTAQANPVTVALQATNIPPGTTATVILTPESGAIVAVQSTGLAGNLASSSATASLSLPTTGASLISVQLSFTPTGNRSLKSELRIEGESVKLVEVAAKFGSQSEVTYITESGKRIRR